MVLEPGFPRPSPGSAEPCSGGDEAVGREAGPRAASLLWVWCFLAGEGLA